MSVLISALTEHDVLLEMLNHSTTALPTPALTYLTFSHTFRIITITRPTTHSKVFDHRSYYIMSEGVGRLLEFCEEFPSFPFLFRGKERMSFVKLVM